MAKKKIASQKKPALKKKTAGKIPTKRTSRPKASTSTVSSSFSEYKILTEDSARGLEDQVVHLLKKGWLPAGGLVIENQLFSQALYR